MLQVKEKIPGVLLCFLLALPCWWLGHKLPVIGAPVFAIVLGMILTQIFRQKGMFQKGIQYTSKKILQYAVILLGFGLNLSEIAMVGATSLPIIVSTIATSLIVSYVLHRLMHMDENSSILIGVGSSICGGSAIAATAPVIDANDEEIAQAISVIFFFNVIAAVLFPVLGSALGFDTTGGGSFGLFAGTAINDTSSVTAGRLYLGQYVEPWKRDTEYCCYGKAYTYTGNYSDHTGIIPDPCKICLKSRNC
mgnify:CR=1 FL=1